MEDENELSKLNSNHSTNLVTESPSISSGTSTPLLSSYSSLSSTVSTSSIIEDIGDAGVYSLCGLCTLLFCKYFPEPRHKPFVEKTINNLVAHFKLPGKVGKSLNAMLDCDGGDLNSFIKLIHKEMDQKSIKPNQIIQELIIFALKDGVYDARLRVVILKLAYFIEVPLEIVELYEQALVEFLSNEMNAEDEDEKRKRNLNKKIKRYTLVALASVGGGVIIGLTGGLSAPLLAAGATALTSGAAILGSTAGVAVIVSIFGVAGAGLTGYKMNKRVGNIEEFAFEHVTEGRQLHLTIAISGWISEQSETAFSKPWQSLANSQEQYCIRYESSYLLELGRAIDYLLGFAISMAAQEALKYTLLSGIIAAIAWPAALVTFSSVIDNPWGVCIRRSAEVGKHLADILLTRKQGQRPVSLIGFSLGARVIFFCMEELANRKDSDGIIENVILLGAPVSASPERWQKILPIISGRLVNGYCRGDWLLKFLYRTSTATLRIAGLQAIDLKHQRLENFDFTDVVTGHMDYMQKMDTVLTKVGIRTRKVDEEESQLIVEESDELTGNIPVGVEATENLAKVNEATENVPKVNDATENVPKVNEATENVLKVNEATENVPKVNEATENVPKVVEATENVPKVNEATENVPKVNEATENVPKVNEATENVPKVNEATENVPKVVEATENVPKVNEATENVPKVNEATENVPKVNEATENVPKVNEATENVPKVNEATENVAKVVETNETTQTISENKNN